MSKVCFLSNHFRKVKEMNDKNDKKFYWVEGVTKTEVISSLNDTKPSIFRNQRNRKILVAMISVLIICFALIILIEQPKLKSYVEISLLAVAIVIYFPLRRSVRHIADAPNELLDERQIALRNNAYLFAYRGMFYVALIYVVVYYLISREHFQISIPLDEIKPTNVILSFFFWMAYMPSMVLAWGMPSEDNA